MSVRRARAAAPARRQPHRRAERRAGRGERAPAPTTHSASATKWTPAGGTWRVQRRVDRLDEIADVEQAAPIADRAQRQPAPARDLVEQRREIALDARTVDERQPQHDRRHRRSAADAGERALGSRACCARRRRAAPADRRGETGARARSPRRCTLTVLANTNRRTPARTAARARARAVAVTFAAVYAASGSRAVSPWTCARPARCTTAVAPREDRVEQRSPASRREIGDRAQVRIGGALVPPAARTSARIGPSRRRRNARRARGR